MSRLPQVYVVMLPLTIQGNLIQTGRSLYTGWSPYRLFSPNGQNQHVHPRWIPLKFIDAHEHLAVNAIFSLVVIREGGIIATQAGQTLLRTSSPPKSEH